MVVLQNYSHSWRLDRGLEVQDFQDNLDVHLGAGQHGALITKRLQNPNLNVRSSIDFGDLEPTVANMLVWIALMLDPTKELYNACAELKALGEKHSSYYLVVQAVPKVSEGEEDREGRAVWRGGSLVRPLREWWGRGSVSLPVS